MIVRVTASDDDVVSARDGVNDLAFDAAMGMATIAGIGTGSPRFDTLYRQVLADYTESAKYLLYFMHLGVTSVKLQMETGAIKLVVPTNPAGLEPDMVAEQILKLARPIAACLLHVFSVGDKLLISDNELDMLEDGYESLGIDFNITQLDYNTFRGSENE